MYCVHCGREVAADRETKLVKQTINGISFEAQEVVLSCPFCGSSVYDAEVFDSNMLAANNAYRRAAGIITTDELEQLLKTYNIGKKPLAQLAGWGEATVLRYFEGLTPARRYSDFLKSLFVPQNMLDLFRRNSGNLSPAARKKLQTRLDELTGIKEKKLLNAVRFFLLHVDEEAGDIVTHMKLQKLLYFSQAWCLALFDRPLFMQPIEAWVHGPVVREVFSHYTCYGNGALPRSETCDFSCFDDGELTVLNFVEGCYGKYDASYLRRVTHKELPWSAARDGIPDGQKSDAVISHEDMTAYYHSVADKFGISPDNPAAVQNYLSQLEG